MIKNIFYILSVILSTTTSTATAQDFNRSKEYAQTIFQYPIDLPPSTAGSFAELRKNHFHSGLDFRTMQRTGYPIHTPADGYISRLKIQFGGFGQAVYITHPNGYTTVYGHLDHFTPEILQYIRQQQAKQQLYEVDLELQPNQMKLLKGQVFAWSGNTGASGGPHLHFEIRDTKTQETINPQLFGLTIPDRIPPAITSISVYQLNGHPFNQNTLRQTYPVKGLGGDYHLLKPQTLQLSGSIGFGITANDLNSAGANRNGVFSIELKVDGKTAFIFAAERFAFDQTHAINAYIDYPYNQKTGGFIQKCFVLPGARITLYPKVVNKGVVTFNDTQLHQVQYIVKDIAGNQSTVNLQVQASIPKERNPIFNPEGILVHYDNHSEFANGKMKLVVEPYNLYDDLDLIYSAMPRKPGSFSDVHRIHNQFTPIHDSLNLYIKPDADIGKYANKAVIYGTATGAVESEYANGYIKGIIKAFGDYDVRIDTIAPVITPVNIHNGSRMGALKTIIFNATDNMSGIKTFVGKIDGRWVLVEHDYKTKRFIYTFDATIAGGKHTFEFTVGDYKNNVKQFTADFYR